MQPALAAARPKARCDAHVSGNSQDLGVFMWERNQSSYLSLCPCTTGGCPSSGCPALSSSLPHSLGRQQGPNEWADSFPSGLAVMNPPAKEEIWVRAPGQEDLLEKEMATQSSILAWRIRWTEEPGGLYSSWGCKVSAVFEAT